MFNWERGALALSSPHGILAISPLFFPIHSRQTLPQNGRGPCLVAVKFIIKSKVSENSRVYCRERNCMIPKEVALIQSLNHPSIIKFLDFYQVRDCASNTDAGRTSPIIIWSPSCMEYPRSSTRAVPSIGLIFLNALSDMIKSQNNFANPSCVSSYPALYIFKKTT